MQASCIKGWGLHIFKMNAVSQDIGLALEIRRTSRLEPVPFLVATKPATLDFHHISTSASKVREYSRIF
jgi:hypothetical protein